PVVFLEGLQILRSPRPTLDVGYGQARGGERLTDQFAILGTRAKTEVLGARHRSRADEKAGDRERAFADESVGLHGALVSLDEFDRLDVLVSLRNLHDRNVGGRSARAFDLDRERAPALAAAAHLEGVKPLAKPKPLEWEIADDLFPGDAGNALQVFVLQQLDE